MPEGDLPGDRRDSLAPGDVIGTFVVGQALAGHGDVLVSRARDQSLERTVVLRVVHGTGAASLLADSRRIAAVAHPNLVVVLAAGSTESGSYVAVADLAALPLSAVGPLSSQEAAHVAIDIAGAIQALAEQGLRAPITAETVLVSRTVSGMRALLDPLRVITPGASCLSQSDGRASTSELVDLIERCVPAPSPQFRRGLDHLRCTESSTPGAVALALGTPEPVRRGRAVRRSSVALVTGLTICAVLFLGAVVYEVSGGHSHRLAAREPPAARIVARIPLGLAGSDAPLSLAVLGRTVWVSTRAGRLLRVDASSNQIAGTPLDLGGKHPELIVTTSGGMLYAADAAGWVMRIDPNTLRVTRRRRFGRPGWTGITAADGVLWLASDEGAADFLKGGTGSAQRLDPGTLRPIGAAISTLTGAYSIAAVGSHAWVIGGLDDTLVERVDTLPGTQRATRKVAFAGPEVTRVALDGDTLWITDRFNGTATGIDAERMRPTRPAIRVGASAFGIAAVGADIWVTASSGVLSGSLRVGRFDARSGRQVGTPVTVAAGGVATFHGGEGDLAFGLGSLWAVTSTALVRLVPTTPRPARGVALRIGRPPHPLGVGPLSAGSWRPEAFAAPFTLETPSFSWVSVLPGPDFVSFRAATGRAAEIDVDAPSQVFTADGGSVRTVTSPAQLLGLLRRNRYLSVGAAHHVMIGGRPAVQFTVAPRSPLTHAEVCLERRCVLLFPLRFDTATVNDQDTNRFSLLRSRGRTVVIDESGPAGNATALFAKTTSLVRTFHFEP
jgi:DNA-binding beta-propeller fold protein YncE